MAERPATVAVGGSLRRELSSVSTPEYRKKAIAMAEKVWNIISQRHFHEAEEIIAPDCVRIIFGKTYQGRDHITKAFQSLRGVFGGSFQSQLVEVIAEPPDAAGNYKFALEWSASGFTLPTKAHPTEKSTKLGGVSLIKVEGGLVREFKVFIPPSPDLMYVMEISNGLGTGMVPGKA